MVSIRDVSYDDLLEYKEKIDQEIARRDLLQDTENEFKQLSVRYLKAKGVSNGDSWVEPESIKDSYPEDWIVTYGGDRWKSTTNGNMSVPGDENWIKLTHSKHKIEPNPKEESLNNSIIKAL